MTSQDAEKNRQNSVSSQDAEKNRQNSVTSPAELNDYIRVSSPVVWIVLSIVIVCLLAAIAWGIFGTLEITDEAGNIVSVHPITFVTN